MIPLAAPGRILLDFEKASISSFKTAFPHADILGCYFYLTHSIIQIVNEIGMKMDYECNDNLRTAVLCLPAFAMVQPIDVIDFFRTLADIMPDHDNMAELLSYFEHTYIRGRRKPGLCEHYGPALFPIQSWNHYDI